VIAEEMMIGFSESLVPLWVIGEIVEIDVPAVNRKAKAEVLEIVRPGDELKGALGQQRKSTSIRLRFLEPVEIPEQRHTTVSVGRRLSPPKWTAPKGWTVEEDDG